MNSPNQDDLINYLYEEADQATCEAVEVQLNDCPETRTQVETWKETMSLLDRWEVEAAGAERESVWPAVRTGLQVAAAVAVLLGVGAMYGRHLTLPTEGEISAAAPAAVDEAKVEMLVAERLEEERQRMVKRHEEIEEKLILASGAMTHRQVQSYLGQALQQLEKNEVRNEALAMFLPPNEQVAYQKKREALKAVAAGVAREGQRHETYTRQIIERARRRALQTH